MGGVGIGLVDHGIYVTGQPLPLDDVITLYFDIIPHPGDSGWEWTNQLLCEAYDAIDMETAYAVRARPPPAVRGRSNARTAGWLR